MKKSLATFFWLTLILLFPLISWAQDHPSALHTEIFILENGLTVYLNEDPSLPNVFGAVAIKAGSKHDPPEATGVAHYFEHIMFKGTNEIGTIDYPSEKVYLDSIAQLYDALALSKNAAEREGIQQQINRLSLKAATYAIPNELGKILDEMGSSMVNAGTGNEEIVYFNIFPSNQIHKWLEVYSHRFIHPVYRLFQSELETVYEEYNMYKDNRFATAFEAFNKAFYPSHPYGVPIIGYPEHLKNPSLRRMNEFFETYYVANNMALILSGNFKSEEVKPLIEEMFGVWRSAPVPPLPSHHKVEPFKGRNLVQKRLTPIKFGILGYRLPPINHPDKPVLDVMNQLLTNSAQTGLLDELTVENKLLGAFAVPNLQVDAGSQLVFFLPKIVGQSLKSAEKLVLSKIADLKEGQFDDVLFEAVKTQVLVDYQRNFEDQYKRGYLMITSFVKGLDWDQVVDYPKRIQQISQEEVTRAARTYFGDDYLAFHAKTGLAGKPAPIKPSFEPIPSMNTDKRSEFAKRLGEMPIPELEPHFINFGSNVDEKQDVSMMNLDERVHLYHSMNPVNDLFKLRLSFGIGAHKMPILEQVSEYLSLVGTQKMPFKDFSRKLQAIGGSYEVNVSEGEFNISCSGPDRYLEQILTLVSDLIYEPALDDSKMKNLYQSARAGRQVEQKDPETVGYALYQYALMGNKSPFLRRLSLKELKDLNAHALVEAFGKVTEVELDIHYSGTRDIHSLSRILDARLQFGRVHFQSESPVKREYLEYGHPVVFFLNDPKAIQSKNYFYLPGSISDRWEQGFLNAYKEYLDGGMHSVLFQEIRELRSLAYATGAQIYIPYHADEITGLTAYVGTQADKTREAVEVMHDILTSTPNKPDRLEMVKQSLIQSINSKKPTFRSISNLVADWHTRGFEDDPRRQWITLYQNMEFNEIADCYERQFARKPMVVTIIGNEKRMGTQWMADFGEWKKVSKKHIFN